MTTGPDFGLTEPACETHAGNAKPSGLLAAGSDIIDNANGLEKHLLPLLVSH
jgi:hypothetical protein